MTSPREVEESPKTQGEDEILAYTFNWSSTPSAPVVVIKDMSISDPTQRDRSAVCLSGSVSIVGNTVVTPLVLGLKVNGIDRTKYPYRLECLAVVNGKTLEAYCDIIAEE